MHLQVNDVWTPHLKFVTSTWSDQEHKPRRCIQLIPSPPTKDHVQIRSSHIDHLSNHSLRLTHAYCFYQSHVVASRFKNEKMVNRRENTWYSVI